MRHYRKSTYMLHVNIMEHSHKKQFYNSLTKGLSFSLGFSHIINLSIKIIKFEQFVVFILHLYFIICYLSYILSIPLVKSLTKYCMSRYL